MEFIMFLGAIPLLFAMKPFIRQKKGIHLCAGLFLLAFILLQTDTTASAEMSANVSLNRNTNFNEIPERNIEVNSKYCTISITSSKPIYYSYLSLSSKKYIVKSGKLKKADYIDGKYVIDYSTCNPLKSYCIGIGTRNENYTVDGFTFTYKDEEKTIIMPEFDSWTQPKTKKPFSGNKYYTCIASTFDYTYQINAYYKQEIDSVSNVTWNVNNENQHGKSLIWTAKIKSSNEPIEYNYNLSKLDDLFCFKWSKIMQYGKMYPKKTWTYPSAGRMEYFPYDFIWRERNNQTWLTAEKLTTEILKEYMLTGKKLQLRFACVHDCHTTERTDLTTNNEIFASHYQYEGQNGKAYQLKWGDRYGTPLNITIKKVKVPKAPKVTVNVSNERVSLKNGMQFSFYGDHWITILPYAKTGEGATINEGYSRECIGCYGKNAYSYDGHAGDLGIRYTERKITSLHIVDLWDLWGGMHDPDFVLDNSWASNKYQLRVRTLGTANRLPSEITTVEIPKTCFKPECSFANTQKGYKFLHIAPGKGNPYHEYGGEQEDTAITKKYEYTMALDINVIEEKVKQFIEKKYGAGFDNYRTEDIALTWYPCTSGTVLKKNITCKANVCVEYENKKGWISYKRIKYSINVPQTSGTCILVRRKSIKAKKNIKQEFDSAWERWIIRENDLEKYDSTKDSDAYGYFDKWSRF